MKTIIGFCLALILLVPGSLLAQQGALPPIDTGRFTVFIHGGNENEQIGSKVLREIGTVLVKKGYVVRAPDFDQDTVGGPGVDYFSDDARDAAQDVADEINRALRSRKLQTKELKPRRQNVRNPPGYLGVWLF
ncbi:MAG: hypothetical protein K2Y27_23365 [Xanthobacteraceae bacterium]|nr:hypothetical protein [Xanthobacteraceae bacterium]